MIRGTPIPAKRTSPASFTVTGLANESCRIIPTLKELMRASLLLRRSEAIYGV